MFSTNKPQNQLDKLNFKRPLNNITRGVSNAQHKINSLNAGNAPNKIARPFEQTFKRISRRADELKKRIESAANVTLAATGMEDFGKKTLSALSAPIQAGMDFTAEMSRVSSVTLTSLRKESPELAKQALEALTAKARELGGITAWSATQIAQGMSFLGMSGMGWKDITVSMKGLADLASAGGLDLQRTADIASNVATTYWGKDAASQYGRLSDVMAHTATNFNVDISMMGESLKYVAPIASQVGVSFEELSAAIGIAGNSGIQGSMAGTSLRKVLTRLSAPPRVASESLKALGVEATELDKKTGKRNLRNFPEILKDIARASEKMGTADKAKHFSRIAGLTAVSGFAVLVKAAGKGELDAEIARMGKHGENVVGVADMVAKEMINNLKGDITILSSITEALKISIFSTVEPLLRFLVQTLQTITGGINDWVQKNEQLVRNILTVTATVAGAAIAVAFFLKTIAAISIMIGVVKFALTGLISLSLPLIGIASVGLLIYRNWSALTAFFSGFINGFKQAFTGFAPIVNGLTPIYEFFLILLMPIERSTKALSGFFNTGEAVGAFIGKIAASGISIMLTLADGVIKGGRILFDALFKVFLWVRDLLPFSNAKIGPLSNLTESGRQIVVTIANSILNTRDYIFNIVHQVLNGIADILMRPVKLIKAVVNWDLGEAFSVGFLRWMGDFYSAIANWHLDSIFPKSFLRSLGDIANIVIVFPYETIKTGWEMFISMIGKIINTSGLGGVVNSISHFFRGLVYAIGSIIDRMFGSLRFNDQSLILFFGSVFVAIKVLVGKLVGRLLISITTGMTIFDFIKLPLWKRLGIGMLAGLKLSFFGPFSIAIDIIIILMTVFQKEVISGIEWVIDGIDKSITVFVNKFGGFWTKAIDKLAEFANSTGLTAIWKKISRFLINLFPQNGVFLPYLAGLFVIVETIGDEIAQYIRGTNIWKNFSSLFVTGFFSSIVKIGSILSRVGLSLLITTVIYKALARAFHESSLDLSSVLTGFFAGIINLIIAYFTILLNNILYVAKPAFETFKFLSFLLLDVVKQNFSWLGEKIKTSSLNILEALLSGIKQGTSWLYEKSKSLLIAYIMLLWSAIKNLFSWVLEKIKPISEDFYEKILGFINTNTISVSIIDFLKLSFDKKMEQIRQSIQDGVKYLASVIVNFVFKLFGNFSIIFHLLYTIKEYIILSASSIVNIPAFGIVITLLSLIFSFFSHTQIEIAGTTKRLFIFSRAAINSIGIIHTIGIFAKSFAASFLGLTRFISFPLERLFFLLFAVQSLPSGLSQLFRYGIGSDKDAVRFNAAKMQLKESWKYVFSMRAHLSEMSIKGIVLLKWLFTFRSLWGSIYRIIFFAILITFKGILQYLPQIKEQFNKLSHNLINSGIKIGGIITFFGKIFNFIGQVIGKVIVGALWLTNAFLGLNKYAKIGILAVLALIIGKLVLLKFFCKSGFGCKKDRRGIFGWLLNKINPQKNPFCEALNGGCKTAAPAVNKLGAQLGKTLEKNSSSGISKGITKGLEKTERVLKQAPVVLAKSGSGKSGSGKTKYQRKMDRSLDRSLPKSKRHELNRYQNLLQNLYDKSKSKSLHTPTKSAHFPGRYLPTEKIRTRMGPPTFNQFDNFNKKIAEERGHYKPSLPKKYIDPDFRKWEKEQLDKMRRKRNANEEALLRFSEKDRKRLIKQEDDNRKKKGLPLPGPMGKFFSDEKQMKRASNRISGSYFNENVRRRIVEAIKIAGHNAIWPTFYKLFGKAERSTIKTVDSIEKASSKAIEKVGETSKKVASSVEKTTKAVVSSVAKTTKSVASSMNEQATKILPSPTYNERFQRFSEKYPDFAKRHPKLIDRYGGFHPFKQFAFGSRKRSYRRKVGDEAILSNELERLKKHGYGGWLEKFHQNRQLEINRAQKKKKEDDLKTQLKERATERKKQKEREKEREKHLSKGFGLRKSWMDVELEKNAKNEALTKANRLKQISEISKKIPKSIQTKSLDEHLKAILGENEKSLNQQLKGAVRNKAKVPTTTTSPAPKTGLFKNLNGADGSKVLIKDPTNYAGLAGKMSAQYSGACESAKSGLGCMNNALIDSSNSVEQWSQKNTQHVNKVSGKMKGLSIVAIGVMGVTAAMLAPNQARADTGEVVEQFNLVATVIEKLKMSWAWLKNNLETVIPIAAMIAMSVIDISTAVVLLFKGAAAGIAFLFGWIIGTWLYQNIAFIREGAISIVGFLVETGAVVWEKIQWIISGFQSFGTVVQDVGGLESISGLFTFITDTIIIKAGALIDYLNTTWSGLGDLLMAPVTFIGDVINAAGTMVGEIIGAIVIGDWAGIGSSILTALGNTLIAIGEGIKNIGIGIVKMIVSGITGSVSSITSALTSGVKSSLASLKGVMGSMFEGAAKLLPHSDAAEGPFSTLTAAGRSIPRTIGTGILQTKGVLKDSLNTAFNAIPSLPPPSSIEAVHKAPITNADSTDNSDNKIPSDTVINLANDSAKQRETTVNIDMGGLVINVNNQNEKLDIEKIGDELRRYLANIVDDETRRLMCDYQ